MGLEVNYLAGLDNIIRWVETDEVTLPEAEDFITNLAADTELGELDVMQNLIQLRRSMYNNAHGIIVAERSRRI